MRSTVFICILLLYSQMLWSQHKPLYTIFKDGHHALSLDYSPDGRFLASGGDDNAIVIWDISNNKIFTTLTGHTDWVTEIEFIDQTKLATASKSGDIKVYDIQTGHILHQYKGHTGAVNSISFDHNQNALISAGDDGLIIFWDLQKGEMLKKVGAHSNKINVVKINYRGNKLISGDSDGQLKIWDAYSGKLLRSINAHKSWLRDAGFIQYNGNIFTVSDDKMLKLWSEDGSLIKETKAHRNWIHVAKSIGDGKYIATGGHDSKVVIWNSSTLQPLVEKKQEGSFITDIALSNDLQQIAVSGYHEKINIWDVSNYRFEVIPGTTATLALSPKSKTNKTTMLRPEGTINMIQPKLDDENKHTTLEKELILKGQVKGFNALDEVWVNGQKATIVNQTFFEFPITLGYLENEIEIKAFDQSGYFQDEEFTIIRVFDKNNPEETVGLSYKGKNYALLIATDSYDEMQKLSNPIFDATTISSELEENYGFETEIVINPTRNTLLSVIRKYSKRLYADEDQLFIFIAGHGEFDEIFMDGYIVARDSKKDDEIKSTYISHSSLRTIVNNIPCRHILLTMDVCFGGTFDQATARSRGMGSYSNVDREEFIKRKLKYKTRLYLTSGGKEYVPDGRPNFHSPFARKFIEGLRSYGGEDGILTFNEMLTFIEKASPEPRHGEFGDNEPGSDFLFISSFDQ